ncbi:hypothetical protein HDV03_005441 [Kappamyces sp. JEL0829]|nr:hypothetical protein HDV03_005441 [Kappamyces sp. JEL0829]
MALKWITCRPHIDTCAAGTVCCLSTDPHDQASNKSTCRPANDCMSPRPSNATAFTASSLSYANLTAYLDVAVARYIKPNLVAAGPSANCLSAHNLARQLLGLAALSWDAALAQSAQVYSDALAARDGFEHSSDATAGRFGENLWAVYGGSGRCSDAVVDGWFSEYRIWNDQCRGNPTPSLFHLYGHYTQMMLADATRVGCGITLYHSTHHADAASTIVVCHYDKIQSSAAKVSTAIPALRPPGL